MRQRWLSRRALTLHLAVAVWVPFCLVAGWWQVTRALDGNGLSYLYSAEWPILAILGAFAWWSLVHTDPETVGARAQRRMLAESRSAAGAPTTDALPADATADGPRPGVAPAGAPGTTDGVGSRPGDPAATSVQPGRRREKEDEALAAYNDRLAELALSDRPKTWRRP